VVANRRRYKTKFLGTLPLIVHHVKVNPPVRSPMIFRQTNYTASLSPACDKVSSHLFSSRPASCETPSEAKDYRNLDAKGTPVALGKTFFAFFPLVGRWNDVRTKASENEIFGVP